MAGIAALSVGCTIAVRILLPPSRRFRPVPAEGALVRRLTAAVTDPVLLALYALAALLMGAFVAVYNAATFRLEAPPYALPAALAGLVFTAYLLGSASSAGAGELAGRFGRRRVVPVAVGVMGAGAALTLAGSLVLFVAGLVRAHRRLLRRARGGQRVGGRPRRGREPAGRAGRVALLVLVLRRLLGRRHPRRPGVGRHRLAGRGAAGRRVHGRGAGARRPARAQPQSAALTVAPAGARRS
jgi:hypothetical protein